MSHRGGWIHCDIPDKIIRGGHRCPPRIALFTTLRCQSLRLREEPLYYETIEEAAESVSGIVGHEVEATVEAITEALDDYEQEHEDEDVFYSFHEFQLCES